MRRATRLRLLKLAVNTYRLFVAICWSWRFRYRRPIPKANTHTPWLLKASAGLRTRSCEMPSVMTTRAWKEGKIQIDPQKVRANDSRIAKPKNQRTCLIIHYIVYAISFCWLSSYKKCLPFAEMKQYLVRIMLTKRFFDTSQSAVRDDPTTIYLDNKVSKEEKRCKINEKKTRKREIDEVLQ